MAYQSIVLGAYTFTALNEIQHVQMRPAIVAKLLNQDRSVFTDFGAWGVVPWMFRGVVTGVTGRTDVANIKAELLRPYPILFKADVKSGTDSWGRLISMVTTEQDGFVVDGVLYTYIVDVTFLEGSLDTTNASRGLTQADVDESDTFSLTGDIHIPLPVGATSPSETADFTRYADNGATGTNSIPCVTAPDLTAITYTVAEANLPLDWVTITRSNREWIMSNGMVKLQTSHDEGSNKGYVEFWYYSGTAWVKVANIRAYGTKSGGTPLQEITASSIGPEVWPGLRRNPLQKLLRMRYPATATDSVVGILEFEMEYGRPIVKVEVENGADMTLTGHELRLSLVPTDFQYYTRASVERDAQASAYGTEVTVGDTDTNNASWACTTTGAPAAATILCGFSRLKQADSDHVGVDAGNYWSDIGLRHDNVTITYDYKFPKTFIYAGRYDKIGSRTATQLALESLKKCTIHHGIIPQV